MVVVMIIPIAIGVPAIAVLIPPFVIPVPAFLADLVQNATGVFCLRAVPAVMLSGLVHFVIRLGNTTLAICFISKSAGSSCE